MTNKLEEPGENPGITMEYWLKLASDYGEIPMTTEVRQQLVRLSQYESLCLLAAGKAHDFRNLLSIANGNIALTKMKYEDHPQIVQWLEDAETALMQAYGLASQLLDMARGSYSGRQVIQVREMLEKTAQIALSASDVIASYEMDDEIWDVFIDEGQFQQVIINLLVNAVQAMNDRGQIWIAACNHTIRESRGIFSSGKYVKITIRDEGGGIPEEHRKSLFQPFFTTKEQGTGLCLSSCYSIINQHHGYMDFTCDHKGTTFMVYLPAVMTRRHEFPGQKSTVASGL